MENMVQVFNNVEFGQVRVIERNGEPWFVGKDVASILGYKNTKDALFRHIETEDKEGSGITTPFGIQQMIIINESGLYSLILSSKLPTARKFKRWVTSEVLPSIRKTGSYTRKLPTDYLSALKALVATEEDRRKIEAKVQVLEPKANYYDDCMDSTTTFTATAAAKEIGFGKAAQLNEFLHNRGVLYRLGYRKNLSQKPLSCYPWLPTVAYDFLLSDGYAKIITGPEYRYLKWTNKGIKWLKELVVNSL